MDNVSLHYSGTPSATNLFGARVVIRFPDTRPNTKPENPLWFFYARLEPTAGGVPRIPAMSVTLFRTPFLASLGPIFFSVLCLSVERSTDTIQHSCGFAGVGL